MKITVIIFFALIPFILGSMFASALLQSLAILNILVVSTIIYVIDLIVMMILIIKN